MVFDFYIKRIITIFVIAIILPIFLWIGFLNVSLATAATIFTDDFEDYNLDRLHQQGGWTVMLGEGTDIRIQERHVFEGSKAAHISTISSSNPFVFHSIKKSGESVMDGSMVIYIQGFRGGTTNPSIEIQLKEGDDLMVAIKNMGIIFYYFDGDRDSSNYVSLGHNFGWFTSPGWHKLGIHWRSDDHKARYQLNDGEWTDWLPSAGKWENGLDTVVVRGNNGSSFFDAIGEHEVTKNERKSILFLPGIMGSRLNENEKKLWEPGSDDDIQSLYLNQEGKSVKENITATEVVDTFDGPLLFNIKIYDSFLDDLATMKQEGSIADYTAFPYDWRLSIPDIISDGELKEEVRRLAGESSSGKVTIVAHSNGGLLAKALINNLGNEADSLIDQVIFVGVPQIGTPQSIGALLHGYDSGIKLRFSDARARDFSYNAPMAYHLLPHLNYYNNITTPLIYFEPGKATQSFIDSYGNEIKNMDDVRHFILGLDGRSAPSYEDLENPALGNQDLYDNATSYLNGISSDWHPPSSITVHQIAGIGELTLGSINYKTIQECVRRILLFRCIKYEDKLSYDPKRFIDGDSTVITPSALSMNDSSDNVNRWWVNLNEHNRISITEPRVFRDHKNLLEIAQLRNFIFNNLLSKNNEILPDYISDSIPEIINSRRLSFSLHSPLSLSAVDKDGNNIDENNPDSPYASYRRYGEVQIIDTFTSDPVTIFLNGENEGSFTLDIKQHEEGNQIASTTFSAIPSTETTKANMSFPDGTIENAGDLEIDYDGNGSVDLSLSPEDGTIVTTPPPSLSELIAFLKLKIQEFNINSGIKNMLLERIESLDKKIENKKENNVTMVTKPLSNLIEDVTRKNNGGFIDENDMLLIVELLSKIEEQI